MSYEVEDEALFWKNLAHIYCKGLNIISVNEVEVVTVLESEDPSINYHIYRPKPPRDYYFLGDLVVAHHKRFLSLIQQRSLIINSLCALDNREDIKSLVRSYCVKETFSPPLTTLLHPPTSFTLIWKSLPNNNVPSPLNTQITCR